MDTLDRPQFYDGEYLGADDLVSLLQYARTAQSRHALGAHAWGIALGLNLVERALSGGDVEMVLAPGIAWDGHARILAALAPQRLPLDLFADFTDDTPPAGIPLEVWLSYHELPARPPGVGFACPDDALFGRIVETFRIEMRRPGTATDYHAVTVAGRSIEASNALKAFDASRPSLYDESVPQQAFAASGDLPRWPVFVGIVRWRKDPGAPGRLLVRLLDDLNTTRRMRRYVGAVAETILAPDGVLRLRDRSKDPADPVVNYKPPIVAPPGAPVVNDLVWCEGHLRVVGDTRLQNGLLDYRVAGGGDDDVPIYLRRALTTAPVKKTTLDAFVRSPRSAPAPAPPTTDLTRFTVSTADADGTNARECLTVVTQRGAVKQAEVGVNTAEPTNSLHVTGPTGIRYGFAYVTGDAAPAWSGLAFNAYSPPGGPWVIPDGTHKPAALILNDSGGVPQLQFQTSVSGNPAAWNIHLLIKGDTGNVGIGTVAPNAKLHLHSANAAQGDILLFSATADFEYDGGSDKLFVFRDSANGKTAFIGSDIGIGTGAPGAKLHLHSANAAQGDILLFSATADFEYDGGSDKLFVFRDSANGKTAFIGSDIGIGTAAPQTRLHVSGNRIRLGDANKRLDLRVDGSEVDLHTETHHLYIRTLGDAAHPGQRHIIMNPDGAEGNVGIGTTNPQSKLHVTGSMQLDGDQFIELGGVWLTSDARLKHKVEPIRKPLDRLLALKGVSYAWRDLEKRAPGPERELGFLAQDVEAVFPEWVKQTPSGTKAVNMNGMSALLVEAVRALTARCEKLEAELEKLKERVKKGGAKASEAGKPARKPR